jgi:hypothetical protein
MVQDSIHVDVFLTLQNRLYPYVIYNKTYFITLLESFQVIKGENKKNLKFSITLHTTK